MDNEFLHQQIHEMFGPHRRKEVGPIAGVDRLVVDRGLPREMAELASKRGFAKFQEVKQYIHDLMLNRDPTEGLEAALFIGATLCFLEETLPAASMLYHSIIAIEAERNCEPKAGI